MKIDPSHVRGPLHLRSDGLRLSPADYADLLRELSTAHGFESDNYCSSGVVRELELQWAKTLGKERALFLPTGSLANHLAIRQLARGHARVLVPADSHVYCDSVDALQSLSGFNLVPVGSRASSLSLGNFETALRHAERPPHPVSVGAISLECPIRRRHGEVFDFAEMQRVAQFARARKIGLHLDGARLFIASAYTGISPATYAALFDTVYVSLYKSFNATGGAILAGPTALIERVEFERKLFGGDRYQAWTEAAVALHYLDGFEERFQRARDASHELFAHLNAHEAFRVEAVPNGSNVFKLHLENVSPENYAAVLARAGLAVRTQSAEERFQGVWLVVNESLNARPPADVAALFIDALSA